MVAAVLTVPPSSPQASAEDRGDGPGPVPAHLWDGSELPVPGRPGRGDSGAAELPQLRSAAARLHLRALHTQRSELLLLCSCETVSHHR